MQWSVSVWFVCSIKETRGVVLLNGYFESYHDIMMDWHELPDKSYKKGQASSPTTNSHAHLAFVDGLQVEVDWSTCGGK